MRAGSHQRQEIEQQQAPLRATRCSTARTIAFYSHSCNFRYLRGDGSRFPNPSPEKNIPPPSHQLPAGIIASAARAGRVRRDHAHRPSEYMQSMARVVTGRAGCPLMKPIVEAGGQRQQRSETEEHLPGALLADDVGERMRGPWAELALVPAPRIRAIRGAINGLASSTAR